MSEPYRSPKADVNEVNGVAVVARQTAMLNVPAADEPRPCTGVDEVLLENGETVFQCAVATSPECNYIGGSGESVRAHLRAHGNSAKVKKLTKESEELKARAIQAEAELEARLARRRNGSRKGAETRRKKREEAAANGHSPDVFNVTDETNATGSETTDAIDKVKSELNSIKFDLNRLQGKLETIVYSLQDTIDSLGDIPESDPLLAEKAARWDNIRGLLKE